MATALLESVTTQLSRYMPFPDKGVGTVHRSPVCTPVNSFTYEPCLVRLAGISGSLAVIIGAYGAHALRRDLVADEVRLRAFETGSRYHLLHSVALLGSARATFPWLTASLFISGMFIFSATCYHFSITGQNRFRRFTPIGGVLLICAWLSFVL